MRILVWPPAGTPVTAQVVFGHPASGDWTSFRDEARELSAHGVRSCLLQFGRGPGDLRQAEAEARFRRDCVRTVLEASLELSRSSEAPITYVGKNLGAFIGGLAAAKESPIRRFVLAAGVPDLTRFYLTSPSPIAVKARRGVDAKALELFGRMTSRLNPLAVLPRVQGRTLFFQWGERDEWITRAEALECAEAGSKPVRSRFYDDDHDFNGLDARVDRREIILSQGPSLRGPSHFGRDTVKDSCENRPYREPSRT